MWFKFRLVWKDIIIRIKILINEYIRRLYGKEEISELKNI